MGSFCAPAPGTPYDETDVNGDGNADWFIKDLPDERFKLWCLDPDGVNSSEVDQAPHDELFLVMFDGRVPCATCPYVGGSNFRWFETSEAGVTMEWLSMDDGFRGEGDITDDDRDGFRDALLFRYETPNGEIEGDTGTLQIFHLEGEDLDGDKEIPIYEEDGTTLNDEWTGRYISGRVPAPDNPDEFMRLSKRMRDTGHADNPVRATPKGAIPVAVLTTSTFDAAIVDPATIVVAGGTARPNGGKGTVGTLEDIDGDGDLDLLIHIVGAEFLEGATTANLVGFTYSGVVIEGSDIVRVLPAP